MLNYDRLYDIGQIVAVLPPAPRNIRWKNGFSPVYFFQSMFACLLVGSIIIGIGLLLVGASFSYTSFWLPIRGLAFVVGILLILGVIAGFPLTIFHNVCLFISFLQQRRLLHHGISTDATIDKVSCPDYWNLIIDAHFIYNEELIHVNKTFHISDTDKYEEAYERFRLAEHVTVLYSPSSPRNHVLWAHSAFDMVDR